MYLNKVFLYGNLTRDPEVRALPSGQQVASFSLATNRTYKDKNGQKQETSEFHNIVAFGRQADVIAQYMKKGRPIYIEGRIQTRSWEKDGEKKYRTEIVVENFQFGSSSPGGSTTGAAPRAPGGRRSANTAPAAEDAGGEVDYPEETVSADDIPF